MADDDNSSGGSNNDVMKVGPDLGDGFRPYIRHKSDCSMETGWVKPHPDGKPIGDADGLIQLEGREGGDVFNVKTLYERPRHAGDVAGDKNGPAMVSSPAYRDGWDRIFGNKATVGQA
jgi:hypothetical protein